MTETAEGIEIRVIGKRNKERVLYVDDGALKALRVWLAIAVLVSLFGGQALSRPIHRQGAWNNLRRAFQGTLFVLIGKVLHKIREAAKAFPE
jgi:integrase